LKFNSTGSLLWQEAWGRGTSWNGGKSVALDLSGNIYVTGDREEACGAGCNSDVLLLEFSASGSILSQNYWGSGGAADFGSSVAIDSSGNMFVTGAMDEDPAGLCCGFGKSIAILPLNGAIATPNATSVDPGSPLDTPTTTTGTPTSKVQTTGGSESYSGIQDEFLLEYGHAQLPTIVFHTNAAGASITFDGTNYTDGQSGSYSYRIYWIVANPPTGYKFMNWSFSGGVTGDFQQVGISGPGTLQVNFVTTPGPPTNLKITPGINNITLTWNQPVDNGGVQVTSYEVYKGTSSGSEFLFTTSTGITITDVNVAPDRMYYYYVRAENSVGIGTKSTEVSGVALAPRTPPPQSVAIFPVFPAYILVVVAAVLIGGIATIGIVIWRTRR